MGEMYKQLTRAELWAAVTTAIIVLGGLAKLSKDWKEVWQAARRGWKGIGVFGRAVWAMLTWKTSIENRQKILAKQVLDISNQFTQVIAQFAAMNGTLEKMAKQLYPNGGTSPVDSLARIEKTLIEQNKVIETNGLRLEHMQQEIGMVTVMQRATNKANAIMSFELDENCNCVDASVPLLEFFGYQWDDLKGKNFENSYSGADGERVKAKWRRVYETGSDYDDRHNVIAGDGRLVYVRSTAISYVVTGKVMRVVGTVEILEDPSKHN